MPANPKGSDDPMNRARKRHILKIAEQAYKILAVFARRGVAALACRILPRALRTRHTIAKLTRAHPYECRRPFFVHASERRYEMISQIPPAP